MFDILKDSNGRFNKKNILPLIGATAGGIMAALNLAGTAHFHFSHGLSWKHNIDLLVTHIILSIIMISIFGLHTYLSADNIRKNKQIENLKAT